MPAGIEVEVDNGFATLDFVNKSLRGPALAKLIEQGGGEIVETITREGPRRKYRVPLGNAQAAGLIDGSTPVTPVKSAGRDSGSAAALKAAKSTGPYPFPTSRNKWSTGDPAATADLLGFQALTAQGVDLPDSTWKLDEMRTFAREQEIDTTGLTTKAATLERIEDALAARDPEPEVVQVETPADDTATEAPADTETAE
ncbi:hypothetical protein TPA2_gp23 [Tsukamurella phage TPA2]|uniref:hypothetical protein n=1 Tax=Tsukamurella phage TPA2 TaxID=981330 RepID=UPI0001FF8DAE|nr:hypothetical protein TPA2_gp23 [Tsukamurella phage TPA2]ADX31937.1 hypothetical protein [Tsukamurella phage TPA2]